ncbi:hypothetical protein QTP88_012904 [Uroleucon formosanum]
MGTCDPGSYGGIKIVTTVHGAPFSLFARDYPNPYFMRSWSSASASHSSDPPTPPDDFDFGGDRVVGFMNFTQISSDSRMNRRMNGDFLIFRTPEQTVHCRKFVYDIIKHNTRCRVRRDITINIDAIVDKVGIQTLSE